MSNNYLNVGRFYNLTSTSDVTITGASFLHGLYNGLNASATVTVDGTYALHIPVDNGVTFPNPVPFNKIKTSASTIVVLYS